MRNKDLKLKDTVRSLIAKESKAETLIIEDTNNSYTTYLETHYDEIKEGLIPMPEDNEITQYMEELMLLSNFDVEGQTKH